MKTEKNQDVRLVGEGYILTPVSMTLRYPHPY